MRSLLAIVALTGCATSSGVHEIGPGRYTVSSSTFQSLGGSATAKGDALKKARATCEAQGKRLEVTSENAHSNLTSGITDITFRCI